MANILQNGEKGLDSVIAAFSPRTSGGKGQAKVEAQQYNSSEMMLNTDYEIPQSILMDHNIVSLKQNETAKQLHQEAVINSQMIDYSKRKITTFDGVHIDFAMPLLDVIEVAYQLAERVDDKGVPLINENGQSFRLLMLLWDDIYDYKKTGNISDKLQQNANKLKDSFYTEIKTAKDKYYWSDPDNAGNTMLMDKLEKTLADLSVLSNIFLKDEQGSIEYMQNRLAQTSNSVYSYVKADDVLATKRSSKNAKKRLIENPWYLGYVSAIKDSSPLLVQSLEASASSPFITNLEEKVIREIMDNASEVRAQKDILEEELGWVEMNEIFEAPQENGASFNDLLSLQWDLNKTSLDDEIENSFGALDKLSIGFDRYLNSNIPMPSQSNAAGGLSTSGTPLASASAASSKPKFYQFTDSNYETDKDLVEELGMTINEKDYNKLKSNYYSDIRKDNLNELLYAESSDSN